MFYALRAATGGKLWSRSVGQPVSSAPAVANGVVYAGGDAGTVCAFSATTGAALWSRAFHGAVTSPTVVNGRVYAGSADHSIYALSLPGT
jgi:outer membrane protein assembly factor BamB